MIGHNFQVEAAPCVRVDDRAFAYGDSLFETILMRDGQPRYWDDHWARLRDGMRALKMQAPVGFTSTRVAEFLAEVAHANGLTGVVRVRLRVVRRPGGRYTPTQRSVDFYAEADPYTPPPTVRGQVSVSETVWLSATRWSRFKTGSALPYVLAGLERERRGVDELLLLDHRGFLAEATASNVFWEREDALYTPALSSGCVGGVMRRQVLRAAAATGVTVHEGLFRPEVLGRAERVFTTNVAGVVPLATVRLWTYAPTLPAYASSLAPLSA